MTLWLNWLLENSFILQQMIRAHLVIFHHHHHHLKALGVHRPPFLAPIFQVYPPVPWPRPQQPERATSGGDSRKLAQKLLENCIDETNLQSEMIVMHWCQRNAHLHPKEPTKKTNRGRWSRPLPWLGLTTLLSSRQCTIITVVATIL